MTSLESSQCRNTNSTDPNNNFPSMKCYSLRPRAARKCEEVDSAPEPDLWRPSRSKRKQKSVPLSKYRRKTANARERSRMREINEAFESLRRVIPQMVSKDCNGEKLTKITTLRLAMKYISALNNVLHGQDLESDGESLLSDYNLTSPDVRDLPSFTDHSLVSEFFNPLLSSDFGSGQTPMVDATVTSHLSDTSLASADPTLSGEDVSMFTNSSYVFEDAPFLTDFS